MGKTKDITGKRFHNLVALEPTSKRSQRSVIWKFRCTCNNVVEIPLNEVTRKSHPTMSCGCSREGYIGNSSHGRKHYENLKKQYVMGTHIGKLEKQDTDLMKNNTSGYQGVSYIRTRNLWRAEMKFQGAHFSKDFHSFEAAVKARIIMKSERDKFLTWWKSLTQEEQEIHNMEYNHNQKAMIKQLKNKLNDILNEVIIE
ncbi:MAG: hypothetical protein VB106_05305 [Clostridiaceae bacterium]|nr:hypothetical protein [Clostridiaceae bacterium]